MSIHESNHVNKSDIKYLDIMEKKYCVGNIGFSGSVLVFVTYLRLLTRDRLSASLASAKIFLALLCWPGASCDEARSSLPFPETGSSRALTPNARTSRRRTRPVSTVNLKEGKARGWHYQVVVAMIQWTKLDRPVDQEQQYTMQSLVQVSGIWAGY